ncbi:hypothetical protein CTA2_2007 [Colletotrichum tanaceti]|uniref:Tautomerase cis-CaaD-like domain-containing protein n=1 Tax=Colletotrichum tanaceti TaxID=1306861 RepID=A0A4U6XCR6_9PEZI|nr:hypothetical protein CTA2_2007 [Colletotrichum tanaceti]TKW53538.1 hypothetical protein CTA1_4303 [Colletotrichum tanaceti]
MPLWIIYHPEGTFEDDASKEALSTDITKIYMGIGLPAFYVVVNFVKLPLNAMWIGGEKLSKDKPPFIRLSIEQIAVKLPDDDKAMRRMADQVDEVLKPHIADKGYDWEFHIDETDRRLWKIQGLHAPPFGSEQEKVWFKENKALPWE